MTRRMKVLCVITDPLGDAEREALADAAAGGEASWLLFLEARGELERLEEALGGRLERRLDTASLMQQAVPLARERFVRFCAEWPQRPLRDGKGFKEWFVREGLSLWWLCELSQKNTEARSTFTSLCYLDAVRLALSERRYDQVVLAVRDRDLADVLSQLCERQGVPVSRAGRSHGRWAESIPMLLLKRMKDFLADLLCAFLAARLPGPFPGPTPASARRIVFHTWYPTQWVRWRGGRRDRYYLHLPDLLASGADWEPVYACTVQADRLGALAANWITAARQARRDGRDRFVFLQRFATPWEVCRAYGSLREVGRYLRLELRDPQFRATFMSDGLNIFPLARHDVRVSFLRQMPRYLLLARGVRRFIRQARPAWLVTTLETYCSGRAIIWGVRSSGAPTKVIGYQLSPVNANQLFYRYTPEETGRGTVNGERLALTMPLPDLFVLQGLDAQRMLEASGIPPERLRLCGAVRFDGLLDYREQRATQQSALRHRLGLAQARRVVLVAGVVWPARTAQLLRLCAEAIAGRDECLMLFKPHPLYRPSDRKVRAALGRRIDAAWWRWSDESLNLLQAAADVMVTAHSTSDVEALVIGCPVIRVVLSAVESSPSVDVPGATWDVETSAQLAAALEAVVSGQGRSVDWTRFEEGVFFKLDGRAAQRVMDVLEEAGEPEPMPCPR